MEFELGIIASDYIGRPVIKSYDWESQELLKSVNKKNIATLFIDPTKLFIELLQDEIILSYNYIDDEGNDKLISLSDLKAILIRRTRGFSDQIYDYIGLLKEWAPNTKIYDSTESFKRPLSKINTFQIRFGKFNQPKTIIIPDNKLPQFFPLNFPVVVKPTHGWRGKEVSKCDNYEDLKSYFKNYDKGLGYGVVIQELIDTSEEYRVFVINGKAIDLVHKSNPSSIAKNFATGGYFTKRRTKREAELKATAEECATIQKLTFAGVDLTVSNGSIYILECNRNPEFKAFSKATDINVADKIIQFLIADAGLSQSRKDLTKEYKLLDSTEEELFIIEKFESEFSNLETYIKNELSTFESELNGIKKALQKDIATKDIKHSNKLGKNVSEALGEIYKKTKLGLYDKISSNSVELLSKKIGELIDGL